MDFEDIADEFEKEIDKGEDRMEETLEKLGKSVGKGIKKTGMGFKKLGKGIGKGWHGESDRHRDSRKGIKTGRKREKINIPLFYPGDFKKKLIDIPAFNIVVPTKIKKKIVSI